MVIDSATLVTHLSDLVGAVNVSSGDAIDESDTRDEALTASSARPLAVVRPGSTDEVAAIVVTAADHGVPVTARGSGTGLSGGCAPPSGGVVVSFERMARILEIDTENQVAVVEPGLTLVDLDAALAPRGLIYPVSPGESSSSLGGNVGTNAGGMRAVKYGVTRHHVLGIEAVLGTGEVITAGGKFVKSTSGYDLTQLVIGSEGTLALVTRIILRLHPRPDHHATVLAPFATMEEIAAAVPHIVSSGIGPMVVEYIDMASMAGITARAGIDLGIPEDVRQRATAYLVVVLEDHHQDRLDEDTVALAQQLADAGAVDVYVLPPQAGTQLIEARESAFWASKAAGADDLLDVVVPRAAIPAFLSAAAAVAGRTSSLVIGCGHAADGNVHLSVWQGDPGVRHAVLRDIIAAGIGLGGAVSGEHGIGRAKKAYLAEFEDPSKLALMRRIKDSFDPRGILNPGAIFDPEPSAGPRR
ncbi:MAG TPA: FAD-linked oxidase C-terminal domain-containing protein [Acidimicrobiales bacterium]|nr:FAD-linked oxidase C-terminal domain-containing protein [Acidimicrobiales bacterium]